MNGCGQCFNGGLRTLERLGYGRVHVRHGDGYRGWPETAPYDAIVGKAIKYRQGSERVRVHEGIGLDATQTRGDRHLPDPRIRQVGEDP